MKRNLFLPKTALAFLMALFSVWGWGQTTVSTNFGAQSGNIGNNNTITYETQQDNSGYWSPIRIYSNNFFKINAVSTVNITSIKLTYDSNGYYNVSNNYFAGESATSNSSVTASNTSASPSRVFSFSSSNNIRYFAFISSAQVRLTNVEVTYQSIVTSPPVVTGASYSGSVGNSFNQNIVATNNPAYSVTNGSALPAGLNLNTSSGAVTGTPTSAGTFTTSITATNSVGSSSANISFNIAKGDQTVTLNNITANLGSANVTLPSTTTQGLAIDYLSNNSAAASIAGNTLSYTGLGSATITASNVGDSNYNALNQTFTTTVNLDTSLAPIAIAGTNATSNGFTANWNALNGASSYNLDVYTTSGSVTSGATVVGWDFEDGDTIADFGISSNSGTVFSREQGSSASLLYNSAGGNTSQGISSASWNSGIGTKFWKTGGFSTLGFSNLKISSIQRSSGTGPKNFKVQYSLDNNTWNDVTNATITVGDNYTTGVLNSISLPSASENQSNVFIRWIMTSNNQVSNGSVASTGTSAIDNIVITGDQSTVVNNYVLQDENVGNVTSYNVTNLNPTTSYNYVVRGVNGSNSTVNSNVINVITTTVAATVTTTWSGSWDNGTPDATKNVVLTSAYSTSANSAFNAKNITIQNGGSLEITAGNTINAVDVTVEDGGNLIQKDGSTLTYTGTFKVNKAYASDADKYAFWSSPVQSKNMYTAFGATQPAYVTTYNTVTNFFDNVVNIPSNFTDNSGKGYSIKVPTANSTAIFTGAPNNGVVTVGVTAAATNGSNVGYNLIGNPYPSNLNLAQFKVDNANISSTFYFWDNTSNAVSNQNGQTSDNFGYAVFNASGTTGTWTNAPNSSGNIGYNLFSNGTAFVKPGQAFIVEVLNGTSVEFNNDMRVSDAGSFVNKNGLSGAEGKYWLQLTSPLSATNTIAVTYGEGAVNTYDAFDSEAIALGSDALYSVTGTHKLAIQGRTDFVNTDVVPLGSKHFVNGLHTVSLVHKTGLFAGTQVIYLHDKLLNTYTDLQNTSYSYTASAGELTDRFEIVYQNLGSLSTTEVQKDTFEVYRDGEVFFARNNKNIDKLEVFDAAGRKIQEVNTPSQLIRIQLTTKGLYIIKAKSEGKEYTKKITK